MGVINCPDCKGTVSESATACPHCGCPKPKDAADRAAGKIVFDFGSSGPKCKACGGGIHKMDAGARGQAFGSGNLLGAFTNSHRCGACGLLQ